jgi:hypothetical protein
MPFSYNEPITFGRDGSAKEFHASGVDFSEDGPQSWTVAPVAEFDLQFPFSRHDIVMELEASPFVVPDLVATQQTFIYVGGLFVGFLNIRGHAIRSFPLARSAVSGRTVRLSLVIPTAVSPATLCMSDDARELGLRLTFLVFKAVA